MIEQEAALEALCREHPGWAEPWSRLATLLYYKGRFEDSLSAAEEAASIKPWHFEALNVCELILSKDNNNNCILSIDSVADCDTDVNEIAVRTANAKSRAVRLARKALPKLDPRDQNRARHFWVDRAVTQARCQMQCAADHTASAALYSEERQRERSLLLLQKEDLNDSNIWQ